jgi:sugar phosphate isomerase/epimerase
MFSRRFLKFYMNPAARGGWDYGATVASRVASIENHRVRGNVTLVEEFERSPARRARYADSLQELLAEAKRLGVRLVIENHTGNEGLFVTPEDFFGLVSNYEHDGLGACWDTGHTVDW